MHRRFIRPALCAVALAAAPVAAPARAEPPATAAPDTRALAPGDGFRDCADCPEMVVLPAGGFTMGDKWWDDAKPLHRVRVPRPIAVGRYDVTFDEYDACVAAGVCRPVFEDYGFGRGRQPVIEVTWNDAKAYAAWLARKTGKPYRLLTEAEWEYAARAGTATAYWWGEAIGDGNANCTGCGGAWKGPGPAPVGSFAANPFGLSDMAGELWQWVEDCYGRDYAGAPADASVPVETGDCRQRVLRGGAWNAGPAQSRAGTRDSDRAEDRTIDIGFRVAREP